MIVVGTDQRNRHLRFMLSARDVAVRSLVKRSFVLGAVLVKGNRIISEGINNPNKTHPISVHTRSGAIHAEMDTIIGVDSRHVQGSDVYVYRHLKGTWEQPEGFAAISMPCPHCQLALFRAGIRRVFYINREGNIDFLRPREYTCVS